MKRKHPLRRILLGTAATVAGVVALLALKQPAGGQNVAGPPAGQAPPVAATAPQGAGGGGGQTLTGDVVDTQYGPVQVSVTMSGGKVTAAQAVKTPNSGPRSEQIAKDSIPQLNQQAVSAAKVDTVSGATYTSEGYAKSLQSALDKAGTK
ncbi:FMN-binding protein [Streptomyces himastatinicus ATCC 53653]|uniref:FMN-binding protein n=1 Tax=Streptomyces himastatinicus ATCC 53653 TaxID=457427 RepID=D9WQW9_9ACTN|nr:FMN-binding protein [Streptomyces himastatinicus]EFL21946.1 FMN-binding protein [Streptomyces himastatinicus ATCC 53653]